MRLPVDGLRGMLCQQQDGCDKQCAQAKAEYAAYLNGGAIMQEIRQDAHPGYLSPAPLQKRCRSSHSPCEERRSSRVAGVQENLGIQPFRVDVPAQEPADGLAVPERLHERTSSARTAVIRGNGVG